MKRACLLLCLWGCGSGGKTLDMVKGEYAADLAQDAKLSPNLTLKDPSDAWLFVTFFDPDPDDGVDELWADINLDAEVLVYDKEIEEDSDPIKGVTVDGLLLDCQLILPLVTLKVEGEFSEDMLELHLDVEKVGEVDMFLVEPEPECEVGETEETSEVPEECEDVEEV